MEDLISEFINNIYENISINEKEEIKYATEEKENIKQDIVETIKSITDNDIRENVLKEIRRLKENPTDVKSFMDSNGKVNITKLKGVVLTAKTNAEKIKSESNKITNSKETLNQEKQFVNNTSEINKEEHIEFIKKGFEGTDVDKWNENKKQDFYKKLYELNLKVPLYIKLREQGKSTEEICKILGVSEEYRELLELRVKRDEIDRQLKEQSAGPQDKSKIEQLKKEKEQNMKRTTNTFSKAYVQSKINGFLTNPNRSFEEHFKELSDEDRERAQNILKRIETEDIDISQAVEDEYSSKENDIEIKMNKEEGKQGSDILAKINSMR